PGRPRRSPRRCCGTDRERDARTAARSRRRPPVVPRAPAPRYWAPAPVRRDRTGPHPPAVRSTASETAPGGTPARRQPRGPPRPSRSPSRGSRRDRNEAAKQAAQPDDDALAVAGGRGQGGVPAAGVAPASPVLLALHPYAHDVVGREHEVELRLAVIVDGVHQQGLHARRLAIVG